MANIRLPVDITPITNGLKGISEALGQIRDSVALLPEVAVTLEEIRKGVALMGDEVHSMRKGVDELSGEVKGMRSAVEPLVAHLDHVADRVDALEPRLEDMSLAIHPLRRAGEKLRRRERNGEPVGDLDAAEGAPGEDITPAEGRSPE